MVERLSETRRGGGLQTEAAEKAMTWVSAGLWLAQPGVRDGGLWGQRQAEGARCQVAWGGSAAGAVGRAVRGSPVCRAAE